MYLSNLVGRDNQRIGYTDQAMELLTRGREMYAVFCKPKNKSRASDGACLDPLDFGRGEEHEPSLLLRRGRVGLFTERDDAEAALKKMLETNQFPWFTKRHNFLILECVAHSREDNQ